MYILYVDASGQSTIEAPDPFFALVGLCVHEGTWYALEKRVAGLKARYACPGVPFELHVKDFNRTISGQEKIPEFAALARESRREAMLRYREARLASLPGGKQRDAKKREDRATDPFIHLTRAERTQLYTDALDLIGSHDGIRLFGEVVDKKHLLKAAGARDAMKHAFAQIVSRFDAFLCRVNGPGFSGCDKGLLVFDREPTAEGRLRAVFEGYRASGHPFGEIVHVIEAPFFVDSAQTTAVQVVDVCAYALRRYVERWTLAERPTLDNLKRIFHRFDREGPRLHGLRHYCAKGTCGCLICTERHHAEATPSQAGTTDASIETTAAVK